jgi:hypothetical protein
MTLPDTATKISAAARKADRERDALQAMREYQDEQARVDANMARLRALRLAKEATVAAASQATAAPSRPAVKTVRAARSRRSA